MRVYYILFFLSSLILPSSAWAESESMMTSPMPVPPEIVLDRESNEIQFVIDGKVVAIMTRSGLRVRESVEYGGTLTDIGKDHFDKQLPEADGVSDHD